MPDLGLFITGVDPDGLIAANFSLFRHSIRRETIYDSLGREISTNKRMSAARVAMLVGKPRHSSEKHPLVKMDTMSVRHIPHNIEYDKKIHTYDVRMAVF